MRTETKEVIVTKGKLSNFGEATCFFVPSEVTREIFTNGVDKYKDVELIIVRDLTSYERPIYKSVDNPER